MAEPSVLILGIGNLLWADEGFGVRVVEDLHRHYQFPQNVKLIDGGTQGIYLVDNVRQADILIVFDAVDYGLPMGTLKLIEGEEVPKFLGAKKVSLHQTGFQEVLAMAEMLGDYPNHLLLIGVQPVELEDFGGSLRAEMKAQINPAIQAALDYLKQFEIYAKTRKTPLLESETIGCEVMTLSHYEDARPNEGEAYRLGDARLIGDKNWQGPEDFEAEMDTLLSENGGGKA